MTSLRTFLSLAVVILIFAALGCGGSSEEPTVGSIVGEAAADVQQAAESASDSAAGMADKIKEELAAKEAELAKITEQIKQLSPEDRPTDAKDLQAKAEALMQEIQELKDKL